MQKKNYVKHIISQGETTNSSTVGWINYHSWWCWFCRVLRNFFSPPAAPLNYVSWPISLPSWKIRQKLWTQTQTSSVVFNTSWMLGLFIDYSFIYTWNCFGVLPRPTSNHCPLIAIWDSSFDSYLRTVASNLFKLCIASGYLNKTGGICWVEILCYQE